MKNLHNTCSFTISVCFQNWSDTSSDFENYICKKNTYFDLTEVGMEKSMEQEATFDSTSTFPVESNDS